MQEKMNHNSETNIQPLFSKVRAQDYINQLVQSSEKEVLKIDYPKIDVSGARFLTASIKEAEQDEKAQRSIVIKMPFSGDPNFFHILSNESLYMSQILGNVNFDSHELLLLFPTSTQTNINTMAQDSIEAVQRLNNALKAAKRQVLRAWQIYEIDRSYEKLQKDVARLNSEFFVFSEEATSTIEEEFSDHKSEINQLTQEQIKNRRKNLIKQTEGATASADSEEAAI